MSEKAAHLTPTEHRLLMYLVRNAGRIVSHNELFRVITSNNIGSLRSCICRLRNKIEIDPALPNVIITHRGLGYSFAGKEEARWFPESEAAG